MPFARSRVLVSVVPEAKARIKALLPGCELDFLDSYADAALAIKSHRYAVALIGVHLDPLLVRSLIDLLAEIQPQARIVAVAGLSEDPVGKLADARSVEGPFDLTRDPLPPAARAALTEILEHCKAADDR